ncbi:MAG: 50S ribosomal protein L9 [Chloroflexi bacterium]|nr:MAG: 50S ribosomal protein L9 [Chloroflexota bacterium]RLC95641.1 MAG: 50S ribosomal protein L9 [Chloroflexota bacterium]
MLTMRVVFLENVPNVARAGEEKEVADGYGRNFLLPRKLALLATPSARRAAELEVRKRQERQERFAAELGILAQQLEGHVLTFKAKVVEEERLYGSIRDSNIAEELSRLTGLEIERKQVELEEPIRQLGEYEVTVRFGKDLAATIKVIVAQEE